jgi:putative SOS response-associated peptidase YedK
MCARFTQHHTPAQITERFEVQQILFQANARFNIAPGQTITVVMRDPVRVLDGFRWGLIPAWARDPRAGNRLINARAETLAHKPAFQQALLHRRCLIPADGFFEWTGEARKRQPMYIRMRNRSLFAFAGLWEEGQEFPSGPRRTCVIVTVEPNQIMRPLHNRMPSILSSEHENLWLDPGVKDPGRLLSVLQPYPAEAMEAFAVSRKMNLPKEDDPACIEPIQIDPLLPL